MAENLGKALINVTTIRTMPPNYFPAPRPPFPFHRQRFPYSSSRRLSNQTLKQAQRRGVNGGGPHVPYSQSLAFFTVRVQVDTDYMQQNR